MRIRNLFNFRNEIFKQEQVLRIMHDYLGGTSLVEFQLQNGG